MGTRNRWRRPPDWLQPGRGLAVLELVASELPDLLPFVVGTMEASPARSEVLALVKLFDVKRPRDVAARAGRAAFQLDRLERNARRKWTHPREFLGADGLPASILSRFAQARAARWERRGWPRSSELVRLDRRLREAAGKERATAMVREFLSDPPR